MFGKLSWSAIPISQPIPLITSIVVILVVLGVLALVTAKGWWPYLWREWITSVDHKRIGVMYCALGVLMLVRVQDVGVVPVQELGDGRDNPLAVGAVDQQDAGLCHGDSPPERSPAAPFTQGPNCDHADRPVSILHAPVSLLSIAGS